MITSERFQRWCCVVLGVVVYRAVELRFWGLLVVALAVAAWAIIDDIPFAEEDDR